MKYRVSLLLTAVSFMACTARESRPNDSAATATPAPPNVVTITAKDFSFEAPDTIPAGVTTIRLVNQGPNLHHAQLIRLNEGKTVADLEAAVKAGGPPPAWAMFAGGPNPPNPGSETSVTQTIEAGNYAIVCFVDMPGHVPHVLKGMVHGLTVVASTSTAVEPTPDVTIQLVDYAFNTSTPLTAGKHIIRVENAAQQPHEIFIAKLDSGKAIGDLMTWLDKMQGPPPAAAMGGNAFIMPGAHVFIPMDLTPGEYALICFVPDAKDGKPHFLHGMMMQVKVS